MSVVVLSIAVSLVLHLGLNKNVLHPIDGLVEWFVLSFVVSPFVLPRPVYYVINHLSQGAHVFVDGVSHPCRMYLTVIVSFL